jgi:formate dehydrogenase subunit delta
VKRAKIIHQLNQIAAYFAAYGHDEAVAGTVDHIRRFWDPRKRAQLAEILASGGEGLTPIARDSALALRDGHSVASSG